MGERILRPEDMASTSAAVATVAPPLQEDPVEAVAVITLRPTRTKQTERKKVVWTEDTVDNEHMNKKKSKCCCIYEKPRRFGESDSEDSDDECEHCSGHVEQRHHKHAHNTQAGTTTETTVMDSPVPEPTTSITLPPRDVTPPGRPASPPSS